MQQLQDHLKNLDSEILDIAIVDSDISRIYIVTQQGHLYCYDLTQQQLQRLSTIPLPLPTLNHREIRHYGIPKYQIKCVGLITNILQSGVLNCGISRSLTYSPSL
jgi:hypothetical protein